MNDSARMYLVHAAEARAAAECATLDNVREKFLKSAKSWEAMAELANADLTPAAKRQRLAVRMA